MEAHEKHKHEHCHDSATASEGKSYDEVPPGFDGTVYTCPMHPEVRRTKPGSCPICGLSRSPPPKPRAARETKTKAN